MKDIFYKKIAIFFFVICLILFLSSCKEKKQNLISENKETNKICHYTDLTANKFKSDSVAKCGFSYVIFTDGFRSDKLSFWKNNFYTKGILNSPENSGYAFAFSLINNDQKKYFEFNLNDCHYKINDIYRTPYIYIRKQGNILYVEHSNESPSTIH